MALLLFDGHVPLLPNLAGHLLAFFVIAMTCHGELALNRPALAHLTTFYVSLSFGGMLGGLFAGLVAPFTFSWVAEYPILAALAVLCRPLATVQERIPERWFWPVAATVAFAFILPSYLGFNATAPKLTSVLIILVLTLAAISIALLRDPTKSAVAVALALTLIRLYPPNEGRRETLRSFFGVHTIIRNPRPALPRAKARFDHPRRTGTYDRRWTPRHRSPPAAHLLSQQIRHRGRDRGGARTERFAVCASP